MAKCKYNPIYFRGLESIFPEISIIIDFDFANYALIKPRPKEDRAESPPPGIMTNIGCRSSPKLGWSKIPSAY